jgi:hypothetical protein
MVGILGLFEVFFGVHVVSEVAATMLAFAQVSPMLAEESLPAPHYENMSTRFGDVDDKWVGGNLKCEPDRRVMPHDHICAHRSLGSYRKCGTVLLLESPRTKKRSWCVVLDSGPYGARVFTKNESGAYTKPVMVDGKHAWYVKIRKTDKPPASKCPTGDCVGKWRSDLDISPAAAKDLGHNGMEPVRAWRVKDLKRHLDRRRKPRPKRQVFLYEGYNPHDRVAALWAD